MKSELWPGVAWKFQSTHPCRVRQQEVADATGFSRFQSTHPCRVRLNFEEKRYKDSTDFNPRTHVGCDLGPSSYLRVAPDFNPRTHVGCDIEWIKSKQLCFYFNPRTHVGCDWSGQIIPGCLRRFQSTHPCRVRPEINGISKAKARISIHAPM